MFCSDETRTHIVSNGHQELCYLIDFLEDVSRLKGKHYYPGAYIDELLFDVIMCRNEPLWREFRLPNELLHMDPSERDAPEPGDIHALWQDAQPDELKVYWECNQILQQMRWPYPDGRSEICEAAYYVAQLFRYGVYSEEWKALMDKCQYGRKPIDPPTGYRWREPHFSMDRWRMQRLGYADVPLGDTPEFQFG